MTVDEMKEWILHYENEINELLEKIKEIEKYE